MYHETVWHLASEERPGKVCLLRQNYIFCNPSAYHVLFATERIMPADFLMRILINMACDDVRIWQPEDRP
jgi:hypothetical protein